VQRPVTETNYVTQNYLVQRPVSETTYQTQNYTAYQPVTTQQLATVDNGGYVAQAYYQPGDTTYRLRWQPGGQNYNALSGQASYRWGGLGWVPYQAAGQTFVQPVYQSNYQTIAIPQTTLMPTTIQQQVPVQTTRMQSEYVQQQVPVQTMRMQTEVVQQQVPVQTTRMQSETVQQQIPIQTTRMEQQVVEQQVPVQVQKMQMIQQKVLVPETVQKPVTRMIEKKEEVKKIEWVAEQVVRPETVQRQSYKLETIEENVPVRTTTMERYVEKVPVRTRVPHRVEYEVMVRVPRQVTSRIPLSYYDPFSAAIASDYSTFASPSDILAPIDSSVTTASSSGTAPTTTSTLMKPEVTKIEQSPAEDKATTTENEKSDDEKLPAAVAKPELSIPD
jgi:hypothetical protein